jgi:hypothetical protein
VVVEEGEEIQTKENDNLLNKIIANNFPNLKKERVLQEQKDYKASNHKDKRRNIPLKHIIIKTLRRQIKERTLKAVKD